MTGAMGAAVKVALLGGAGTVFPGADVGSRLRSRREAAKNRLQAAEVGSISADLGMLSLIVGLLAAAFELALRVAAPLLALIFLQTVAMGFIAKTVPQINILVVGFAIRALISLMILALILSGAARTVVDLVPIVIDELRHSLTSV